jgi:tetratricopeptide (TPR) repeat protein
MMLTNDYKPMKNCYRLILSPLVLSAVWLTLFSLPPAVVAQSPLLTEEEGLTAVDFYNRGVEKLDAGDLHSAASDFSSAIALDPEDADAYYNRAYIYHQLGNYEAAVADYASAIELKPEFADAYGNRCYALFLLGKYESAIADCTEAIKLDDTNPSFYISRGNARDELGLASAIEDYNQGIELDDSNPQAYYNRALAYQRLEQYEQALEDYTRSLEGDEGFAPAYYNRGIIYFEVGEIERAVEDLEKANELFQEQDNTEGVKNTNEAINFIRRSQTEGEVL